MAAVAGAPARGCAVYDIARAGWEFNGAEQWRCRRAGSAGESAVRGGKSMDDIVRRRVLAVAPKAATPRPSRAEAEAAVRTLVAWAGDDPNREGLLDTPTRVVDAFEEYFSGYRLDPVDVLSRTFEEAGGYDDLVMLRDIRVESHCEHHMAPFLGV